MKKTLSLLLVIAILPLLPSCGYTMSGQATGLPEEIKTVAITVFENNSLEPNIEAGITRAIIDQFTSDGRLKIVPEKTADSVISGVINSYSIEPLAYDANFDVTAYRNSVSLSFEFNDQLGLGISYSSTVSAQSAYSVSTSMVSTESSRLSALTTIGSTVGRSIVGILLESF